MTDTDDTGENAVDGDVPPEVAARANANLEEAGPDEAVLNHWEAVMDDMDATEREYEADGWHVVALHPGDVTLLTGEGDRTGIDVLLPDNEFEQLSDLFDEGLSLDNHQVFKNGTGDTVFLLVAMEDPDADVVVLLPLYYTAHQATDLFERALAEGTLRTYLRTLSDDRIVLTHHDPDLFTPPADV